MAVTPEHYQLPNINSGARILTLNRAPITVAITCRDDALTVRHRLRNDESSESYFDQQRARCIKKVVLPSQSAPVQVANAVSRRNARERKRVKLVNLGFATLRDHVPTQTKTKKLSKVETLRAAISYIRHLQNMLKGRDFVETLSPATPQGSYDDIQETGLEDNSSASEETMVEFITTATSLGSSGCDGTMSPASSTEGSLVTSPYAPQQDEPQLIDIGSWFT